MSSPTHNPADLNIQTSPPPYIDFSAHPLSPSTDFQIVRSDSGRHVVVANLHRERKGGSMARRFSAEEPDAVQSRQAGLHSPPILRSPILLDASYVHLQYEQPDSLKDGQPASTPPETEKDIQHSSSLIKDEDASSTSSYNPTIHKAEVAAPAPNKARILHLQIGSKRERVDEEASPATPVTPFGYTSMVQHHPASPSSPQSGILITPTDTHQRDDEVDQMDQDDVCRGIAEDHQVSSSLAEVMGRPAEMAKKNRQATL